MDEFARAIGYAVLGIAVLYAILRAASASPAFGRLLKFAGLPDVGSPRARVDGPRVRGTNRTRQPLDRSRDPSWAPSSTSRGLRSGCPRFCTCSACARALLGAAGCRVNRHAGCVEASNASGPGPIGRTHRQLVDSATGYMRLGGESVNSFVRGTGVERQGMRMLVAWLIGFLAFFVVGLTMMFAGDALGAAPVRYSDGDEEATFFGLSVMGSPLVVGMWAGQAVYTRTWRAGFTEVGWVTFWAWLIATTAIAAVALVFDLSFIRRHGAGADFVYFILMMVVTCGIGWLSHQWWKARVIEIERRR